MSNAVPLPFDESNDKKRQKREPSTTTANKTILSFTLRKRIDEAAKTSDKEKAFEAHRAAMDCAVQLQIHTYNVLLNICAQCESQTSDRRDIEGSKAEISEVSQAKAEEIFEEMEKVGVKKTEMSYTAMARVYAANGDNEKSYEMVMKLKEQGNVTAKLRTFQPSLQGFARVGDCVGAEKVLDAIESEGLELSEAEFAAMIFLYGEKREFEKGFDVLRKMKTKVRSCGGDLLENVKKFFEANGEYRIEVVEKIDEDTGEFEVIKKDDDDDDNNNNNSNNKNNKSILKLKAVGLDDTELKELIASVGKLARDREAGTNFDDFVKWLESRDSKVSCIIDAANVGMANQNFSGARFHFGQLDSVVEECRRKYCSTNNSNNNNRGRPVVFLHQRRTKDGAAKHALGENILTKLRNAEEIFVTPNGSNDDWYWLYAALLAGEDAILVTNDEMRDHVFQMLPDPNLLRRWKERHQVRFSVTKGQIELYEPPVYTMCIQEDEKEGFWMIPIENEEEEEEEEEPKWLLCKRK